MNTAQHTVTIPVSDYNELLEAKQFLDVKEILPGSDLYRDITTAMNFRDPARLYPVGGIKFYYKIIK